MTKAAQLIREIDCHGDRTLCLWELVPDDGSPAHEERFYLTYWSQRNAQVSTAAPGDYPPSGTWVSRGRQASAISYVANGRKRVTAERIFRTLRKEYQ